MKMLGAPKAVPAYSLTSEGSSSHFTSLAILLFIPFHLNHSVGYVVGMQYGFNCHFQAD